MLPLVSSPCYSLDKPLLLTFFLFPRNQGRFFCAIQFIQNQLPPVLVAMADAVGLDSFGRMPRAYSTHTNERCSICEF